MKISEIYPYTSLKISEISYIFTKNFWDLPSCIIHTSLKILGYHTYFTKNFWDMTIYILHTSLKISEIHPYISLKNSEISYTSLFFCRKMRYILTHHTYFTKKISDMTLYTIHIFIFSLVNIIHCHAKKRILPYCRPIYIYP